MITDNNIEYERKEEEIEEIPCGRSIITKYLDGHGKVVRQDCHIEVTKGPLIGGEAGRIG